MITDLEVAAVTGDVDDALHHIDLCQEADHAQKVLQGVDVAVPEEGQDLVPDRNKKCNG